LLSNNNYQDLNQFQIKIMLSYPDEIFHIFLLGVAHYGRPIKSQPAQRVF